jgi:hypothetical protein
MGCDIIVAYFRETPSAFEELYPSTELAPHRDYELFAVLGMDYRKAGIPPATTHVGVPSESLGQLVPSYNLPWEQNEPVGWGVRWATVDDLLSIDDAHEFVDAHGNSMTMLDCTGSDFKVRLRKLKEDGVTHVVYGFSN